MTTVTTPDGLALTLQHWPCKHAQGSVLLVHGLGEHARRYDHVAAVLNRAGWSVVGYDQRGHGRSPGARGDIATPTALLSDLGAVVDAVRDTRPLVLLGHSLGGLVASRFVAEALQTHRAAWCREVDGLVLSSPALDTGMNLLQRALLGVLHPIAPHWAVSNGLQATWLSHDPTVVAAYEGDALVHDRITAALVGFMRSAGQQVRAQAAQWCVPTLLLWAGADRCVAPAGSAAFAASAPRSFVQAHEFSHMRHEIFNEPDRDLPLQALCRWLEKRF